MYKLSFVIWTLSFVLVIAVGAEGQEATADGDAQSETGVETEAAEAESSARPDGTDTPAEPDEDSDGADAPSVPTADLVTGTTDAGETEASVSEAAEEPEASVSETTEEVPPETEADEALEERDPDITAGWILFGTGISIFGAGCALVATNLDSSPSNALEDDHFDLGIGLAVVGGVTWLVGLTLALVAHARRRRERNSSRAQRLVANPIGTTNLSSLNPSSLF